MRPQPGRWGRRWHTLCRLGWRDSLLLIEAAGHLGVARLAVLMLPLRWLVPWAARTAGRDAQPVNTPATSTALSQAAERVGWAVSVISRHTPWQSQCLTQAIAARWMLTRRGLLTTLHLGVTRSAPLSADPGIPLDRPDDNRAGQMQAHAWLQCDDVVITGGQQVDRYTILATFTDHPATATPAGHNPRSRRR